MNMNEIKKTMLESINWAIYGAARDKNKFYYKIPTRMKKNG